MKSMRKLTEQLEGADDRPELTPLIDVVFMLLLFFIVTTTFAEDTFFPIKLPTGRNTTAQAPTDAVTVDKQFTSVIIKSDEQVDARHIVAVLDILRGLEITEFAVVAESEK